MNVPTDAIPCKRGQGSAPVPSSLHYRISVCVHSIHLLSTDHGCGILMGTEKTNENVRGLKECIT